MLIRLTFGTRKGQVVDLLPNEARAMLADGRAVLPDVTPAPQSLPPMVAARTDRGIPKHKAKAHR